MKNSPDFSRQEVLHDIKSRKCRHLIFYPLPPLLRGVGTWSRAKDCRRPSTNCDFLEYFHDEKSLCLRGMLFAVVELASRLDLKCENQVVGCAKAESKGRQDATFVAQKEPPEVNPRRQRLKRIVVQTFLLNSARMSSLTYICFYIRINL